MLQRASKMLPKLLLLLFSAFIVGVYCREFTENKNNTINNYEKTVYGKTPGVDPGAIARVPIYP